MFKPRVALIAVLISSFLILNHCAKDTIEPELFGAIEGVVINGDTGDAISGVSITTSPATSAILTGSNGTFEFDEVTAGNYTISARKNDFQNASVSVNVRDGRTAFASIIMNPVEEEEEDLPPPVPTIDDLNAIVTSYFNISQGDSSLVDVYYRVENISEELDISRYEVYFEIETDGASFFFDVAGDSLRVGQVRHRQFQKYIQQNTAVNVEVVGVWIPGS
ncbi:MAG: carboxypeptidase-like regulatory domain-containing protein [Balneolia bacterium]|nr:carboxypeptidase-like regulatory domain-containing protein [Balneolia bacterium]